MLHITKIKPLYSSLVTTGERYKEDMIENGIIVSNKGDLKLYQKVIAVGSTVRDINVGDTVMINPMNYAVMKYDKNSLQNDLDNNKTIKWNLPWVTIDDEKGNPIECLLLNDRDIKFVFEGKETNEKILLADKKPVLLS